MNKMKQNSKSNQRNSRPNRKQSQKAVQKIQSASRPTRSKMIVKGGKKKFWNKYKFN